MTNLPQYRCAHCGIVHMVCQGISKAACEERCVQCNLNRHVFLARGRPVFCVKERDMNAFMDMYRR